MNSKDFYAMFPKDSVFEQFPFMSSPVEIDPKSQWEVQKQYGGAFFRSNNTTNMTLQPQSGGHTHVYKQASSKGTSTSYGSRFALGGSSVTGASGSGIETRPVNYTYRLHKRLDEQKLDRERVDAMRPVGCCYCQYPGQKSPQELWTGTSWDVLDFNGNFFRAEGGNATTFNGGSQGGRTRSHSHTASAYGGSINGVLGNTEYTSGSGGANTPEHYYCVIWKRSL